MRYLLLIYRERGYEATGDERREMYAAYDELMQAVGAGGCSAGRSSRTSRRDLGAVREGGRLVTDGPFAETKEQLAGYYLIDVADLDAAIELGRADPERRAGHDRGAPVGSSELRPPTRPSQRGRRPRVPGRLRARRRHPHPGPRRLRPGRGGLAGGLRAALEHWPRDGVPDDPGAWITTRRATARSTGSAANASLARAPSARACASTLRARGGDPGGEDECRDPGRPAAADLHLLSPGARAGGARRADAAHARWPHDARDRARVPRARADDGAAAGAGEAQDPRRPASRTRCRPTRSCPSDWRACCAVLYLVFNEGYDASDGDGADPRASSAPRRSGWRGCCAELMPDEPRGAGCWR